LLTALDPIALVVLHQCIRRADVFSLSQGIDEL